MADPRSRNDYERVMQILKANADKPFVKRILDPNSYPTLPLGNGQHATHLMSWGQKDNGYLVFPTVMMNDEGKLQDFGNDAWDKVQATGDYIVFDNASDADWFSQNYKAAWETPPPPQE